VTLDGVIDAPRAGSLRAATTKTISPMSWKRFVNSKTPLMPYSLASDV
jgi:hypothetical protein